MTKKDSSSPTALSWEECMELLERLPSLSLEDRAEVHLGPGAPGDPDHDEGELPGLQGSEHWKGQFDIADSANAVLAQHGHPPHPSDAYRFFIGGGVDLLFQRGYSARAPENRSPVTAESCSISPSSESTPVSSISS